MIKNNQLNNYLFKKKPADTLGIFRIIFGFFISLLMYKLIQVDFAYNALTGPQLLFKYDWLYFLQPLSLAAMKAINVMLLLAGILVMLGLFYRIAITSFFLGFSYFFFLDKILFNNHLYLIILLAFLMIFIPADNSWSIKNMLQKKKSNPTIYNWHLQVLRWQLFIVYFFGAIAKLNADWIDGRIAKSVVENTNFFLFQNINVDTAVQILSYGGIAFDFLISIFFLMGKRFFWIALAMAFAFHSMNAIQFNDIGIFPYMIFLMSIIFYDPEKFKDWVSKFKKEGKQKSKKASLKTTSKSLKLPNQSLISGFILVYFLIQFTLPLRGYFLTKNPEWSGIASRFSWRMKMNYKEVKQEAIFMVNQTNGVKHPIEFRTYMSQNQYQHFYDDPSNIIQLAHYLKQDVKKKGYSNVSIISEIKLSQAYHPEKFIFQPSLDLTKVSPSYYRDPIWLEYYK